MLAAVTVARSHLGEAAQRSYGSARREELIERGLAKGEQAVVLPTSQVSPSQPEVVQSTDSVSSATGASGGEEAAAEVEDHTSEPSSSIGDRLASAQDLGEKRMVESSAALMQSKDKLEAKLKIAEDEKNVAEKKAGKARIEMTAAMQLAGQERLDRTAVDVQLFRLPAKAQVTEDHVWKISLARL